MPENAQIKKLIASRIQEQQQRQTMFTIQSTNQRFKNQTALSIGGFKHSLNRNSKKLLGGN